ncbi:hypothetical protein DVA86_27830 [Streptomyces armeniacus]|uniref:Uncharacterized protein n=2 Tax=Streptomyces armeniacus TaxID=83291 RepID=A0A345XW52_9ACTN|nr:hypothetical protein DVA86_27830 [Streptomyces armeniacus]
MDELREVLAAAGLPVPRLSMVDDGLVSVIEISTRAHPQARALAALLRRGLKSAFAAEEALREALRVHGLHVPQLTVRDRRVHLGTLTVATAEALAHSLGAPPYQPEGAIEEWPQAQHVRARLRNAIMENTGRTAVLDIVVHPDCLRCDRDAAVEISSSLHPQEARKLATALRQASL